ncbi:hypothetical protein RUM4293_02579 [Ruegeria atlantica]|uniref:Uncharacterized protein n=1 Tax=Ruegeria atlantica TaxID=81569 RepID=A0A0N7LNY1_9RHOB|nr:hypothetical protein RUM4293_02579 [Ruegeria atlantica]
MRRKEARSRLDAVIFQIVADVHFEDIADFFFVANNP